MNSFLTKPDLFIGGKRILPSSGSLLIKLAKIMLMLTV